MLHRFGHFVLDTARRELRQGDTLVAAEPQVFDLLEFLIRWRDRVVSRDDLLEAVWHGRIVLEATLSSRMNSARTAIGDNGTDQRLIRTLPRKGVRFVGKVQEITDPQAAAPAVADMPRAALLPAEERLPSVAVLPFTNMSGDAEQDYFADGITEEIIIALSRSSGLFVIARNTSFIYKGRAVDIRQVGRELGVGYVLEGSVRRNGGHLRISGQLVDAVSGAHLWADRFDGEAGDVFALQDRVAESVAAAIEPTLQFAEIGRSRQSLRPDAYDLLLRAQALEHVFTAESTEAALACLADALAIDPGYAQAMAATAYCHAQRHFQGWALQEDAATRAEAVRLAWRAVELAPSDARVLWMAAFAVWNMAPSEGRERARVLFRRSLLINPNSAMALTLTGWIEVMCGNESEGRELVERAQRLNPRDPRGWLMSGTLALAAVVTGAYTDAVMWAEQALSQNPRFAVALRVLAVASTQLGQHARATQAVQELLTNEPGLTISGFFARIPMPLERMARTYADALKAAGLPDY